MLLKALFKKLNSQTFISIDDVTKAGSCRGRKIKAINNLPAHPPPFNQTQPLMVKDGT